jgi:hypothetical protein
MSKLTQGTQIYFIDPTNDEVVEITGVTNFNPGGAPSDQIETTSLTDTAKTFMRGLRTPGTASLEINADPTNASHIRLHELFLDDTIESIPFAVGWSDGTSDPEYDSDGAFDITGATDRTWYVFDGYVADFPFDFSTNSVVKTSISIQRTGNATWTEAAS